MHCRTPQLAPHGTAHEHVAHTQAGVDDLLLAGM